VRVQVRTAFQPKSSRNGDYWWKYWITITNEHPSKTFKLLRRRWEITDCYGQDSEVEGEGVVGKQPTLAPGASYEYHSQVTLNTYHGMMKGYYTLMDVSTRETTNVKIAPFGLLPLAVEDAEMESRQKTKEAAEEETDLA